MSIFAKKLGMALIGLLGSAGGFTLANNAMENGYVRVGKYAATTYYRADDPLHFYFSLCVMLAFGVGGLLLAAISLFATGRVEAAVVAEMDSALRVRKSIRRLGLIFGVVFLVLLLLVSIR